MTHTPDSAQPKHHSDTLHTIRMRAGKRTYYFDAKRDRKGGHYLTITEARSRTTPDGELAGVEKQKLFVYAEDMFAFVQAVNEMAALMTNSAQDFADTAFVASEADTDTPLANINIALSDLEFE